MKSVLRRVRRVVLTLLALLVSLPSLAPAARAQPVEINPQTPPNYWMVLPIDQLYKDFNPPMNRVLGGFYSLTGVHFPHPTTGQEMLYIFAGSGANSSVGPGASCPGENTMVFRTEYNHLGIQGARNEEWLGYADVCGDPASPYYSTSMMPGGALVDTARGVLDGQSSKVFIALEAAAVTNQASGFHRIVLAHSTSGFPFKHLLMVRIADNQSWGLHAPHCQIDDDNPNRWFCYANIVGVNGTAKMEVLWDQPAPYYGRVLFCMDAACTPANRLSYRMGGPLGVGNDWYGLGDEVTQMPFPFLSTLGNFTIQGLSKIDGQFVGYGFRTNFNESAPPCSNSTYLNNVANNSQIHDDRANEILLFKTTPSWSEGTPKVLDSSVRPFPGWSNTSSSFPWIFEGHTGVNYMYTTTQEDTICVKNYLGWHGQRGSVVGTQLNSPLGL